MTETTDLQTRLLEDAKLLDIMADGAVYRSGDCPPRETIRSQRLREMATRAREAAAALPPAGDVERLRDAVAALAHRFEGPDRPGCWCEKSPISTGAHDARCVETCAALAASYGVPVQSPAQMPCDHVFQEAMLCARCWRTPADIDGGCHHCSEPQASGRCWWCGRSQFAADPAGGETPAPPPDDRLLAACRYWEAKKLALDAVRPDFTRDQLRELNAAEGRLLAAISERLRGEAASAPAPEKGPYYCGETGHFHNTREEMLACMAAQPEGAIPPDLTTNEKQKRGGFGDGR